VTVFLADISSYEHGLSIADLHDCAGVLAKCSEGTYYSDADYDGWRRQTAALGKIFVAYDFVKDNETADAQAAWIADHIADKTLPLMLDVETEGTSKPNFGQVVALIKACRARGLRPKLVYLPYWYWQQIGSPDMSVLNTLGVGLISSSYPNLTIAAAGQVYAADGGDKGKGWNSYGGVAPMLWQFSDRILDGGKAMDMNAYRGTAAQLAAFLGSAVQTPTTTDLGDAMGTIPATIGQKWPEIAADFPANGQFDQDSALIWADGGARAAALYAKQARDAVNALAAKIQQPPAVDVKALAAALQPLLTTGATADEIATAVMHHLSAATANG
jgi:hypothetical protein